jgi:hypothetical protein
MPTSSSSGAVESVPALIQETMRVPSVAAWSDGELSRMSFFDFPAALHKNFPCQLNLVAEDSPYL